MPEGRLTVLDMALVGEATQHLRRMGDEFWGRWTPEHAQWVYADTRLVEAIEHIAFTLRDKYQAVADAPGPPRGDGRGCC